MSAETMNTETAPSDEVLWADYLQQLQEWVDAAATLSEAAEPQAPAPPQGTHMPAGSAEQAHQVLQTMRQAVRSLEDRRDETGHQLSQLNRLPMVGDGGTEPARYLDQSA